MSFWFWHGLRNGIRTTGYPRVPETATGVSPGRPLATEFASAGEAATATAVCPTGAIVADGKTAAVVLGKCVHCQRCRFGLQQPVAWGEDYEWTTAGSRGDGFEPLPVAYRRSTHIMVVDAADCGACLREVKQLNNPFYNMHRLGLFLTATPRAADVLLVVGPVSENMRGPLVKTYEAMPAPKKVIAVGTCAITGGVFGRTFVSAGGVASVLPVDLEVPGEPPPPLAILHGLLVAMGRKPAAPRESYPTERTA
jgi:Ni,Fe-hydrogenase III small subunit